MSTKSPNKQTLPTDRVKEAFDLMSLAAWYRCWAEITESEPDKKSRLEMAAALEVKARALME